VDEFTVFAEAQWRTLWRAAWLLTGDAQHAEDLVQGALERSWPYRARLTSDAARRAYVLRVLTRAFTRDRRRRWHGEIPTAFPPDEAATEPEPEVRLAVRAALDALPARQRSAIVLRYFLDLSEAETADAMGCGVGTVKTHVKRALATLRQADGLHGLHVEETT
jgi:RNA polymerase sigma-70 factor (sigma-E family)